MQVGPLKNTPEKILITTSPPAPTVTNLCSRSNQQLKKLLSHCAGSFDVQPPLAAYYAPSLCNNSGVLSNTAEGWFASDNFGHESYIETDCMVNISSQNMSYLIVDAWLSVSMNSQIVLVLHCSTYCINISCQVIK